MGFNSQKQPDVKETSGNLDTLVAGTITGGKTIDMQFVTASTLSAYFLVEAETDTLEIEALWEVSHTGKPGEWRELLPFGVPVGDAAVLAIGTGGDDPVVEAVFQAPSAVYGYKYVRASLRNQVATGAAVDTWLISYSFLRKDLV
jgi:hypothetical protein